MSLYEGAVKKPIMTSLCFLAVAIFGLFSLSKLPVDLYPDIDTNTIMVMTSYQGASASDIENNGFLSCCCPFRQKKVSRLYIRYWMIM